MNLHTCKKCLSLVVSTLLVAVLVSGRIEDEHIASRKDVGVFLDVVRQLESHYVDTVDVSDLIKVGTSAMLSSLDLFTNVLSEEDLEHFKSAAVGEYGGVGVLIIERKDKNIVVMLYKGRSAHKSGVLIGDEIIEINGEDMIGRSTSHIGSLLKGMPGTNVQLTVRRASVSKDLTFTLAREHVVTRDVPYYSQVVEGVGYIKLSGFTTHAANEVKNALRALKAEGAKKLVLDLRGNPGGVLEEAIKVVNLFVGEGLPVVVTKGRMNGANKMYDLPSAVFEGSMPIVVLIDEKSASASEIVSGALQDYDRAVLMGKPTFGKGLVQTVVPLSHGNQLKLTVSKYYIPSGRSIQKDTYGQQKYNKAPQNGTAEKAFSTRAGRPVCEGRGIVPDVIVEQKKLSPITQGLVKAGLIFDYAALFRVTNESIKPSHQFKLSAGQYKKFITWLVDKDYTYAVEPLVDQMVSEMQQSTYSDNVKAQVKALKKQMRHQKTIDLANYKDEIGLVLQEEILMHYYFQEGRIQAMLSNDAAVQQACALLNDMPHYYALLQVP